MTYLDRLKRWAAPKGMSVSVTAATQREPDYIVAIYDGAQPGPGSMLISRKSGDSSDTAAWYLFNALERLGVEIE